MSLLHTESFVAFKAINSTDDTWVSATSVNSETKKAVALNLRRAGYQVFTQDQTTKALSGGFIPRPDPVNPERVALFFSNDNTAAIATPVAAIRKVLPIIQEPLIGGFSLYIPAEYVKSSVTSAAFVFHMLACGSTDATWSGAPTVDKEVFRITADLLVKWNTDAAQSAKALVPGRLNYIEYRISVTEIRVWIDDVLVLQKTKALNVESVGFAFAAPAQTAPNTHMDNAPGRWSIGNWYNLAEDVYAPNVRLGPTTRVIGIRPSGDVSVDFMRPVGYDTNASVVAQDLVDQPVASLQSTNVGDEDMYSVAGDNSVLNAKLIHAVTTKVLVANLESAAHAIRPTMFSPDGSEAAPVRGKELRLLDPIPTMRNLYDIARRPTDGKLFAVGNGASVFTNSANGAPGSPWTTVSDDGSAIICTSIAFRADGTGVIGRSDGKVGVLAPDSDVPTVIIPGTNGANAINGVVVIPATGRFIVVGPGGIINRSDDPITPASWTKVGTTTLGYVSVAYAPTVGAQGRILAMATNSGSTLNYATSDDMGVTWVTRLVSTTSFSAVTWDGTNFMTTGALAPQFRSTDGAAWIAVGNASTNGTIGAVLGGVAWEYDDSTTFVLGAGGNILVSHDSNSYRALSRVTSVALRGGSKTANGDYIFVGDAGTIVSYTFGTNDVALPALGGYVPAMNSHNVNPTTGLPWTPAEAAATRFGARLVS